MSLRGEVDLCLELLELAGGQDDLPLVRECVEQLIVARQRGRTVRGVVLEGPRDDRELEAARNSPYRLR